MTPKETIIEDLVRGSAFLANSMADNIQAARFGVCLRECNCSCESTDLYLILEYLQFRIDEDLLDEYTEILYIKMILIIGKIVINYPPTVNAGSDKTSQANQSVDFNAVATPGSAAITSYLWTKVSGATVLMTGTTTSQLTVSGTIGDMPIGNYEFKVTVTDANGLTAFDTVKLTVTANNMIAYFGDLATKQTISEAQIEIGNQVTFTPNGNVTAPYSVSTLRFLWFAIPSGQPIKNYYQDVANPLNNGYMGTEDDLFGAPVTVGQYDYYITNYLTSYFVAVPPRGLQFRTV